MWNANRVCLTDSKCSNSYKKTHYQRSKNTQKRSQETQFQTIAKHTWLWNDRLADIRRLHKYHLPITFFSHKYHFSFTNAFFLSRIPFFLTQMPFFSISQIPFFYLTNTTRKKVVNFHPACATDMPGAQDTENNAGMILRFFSHWGSIWCSYSRIEVWILPKDKDKRGVI